MVKNACHHIALSSFSVKKGGRQLVRLHNMAKSWRAQRQADFPLPSFICQDICISLFLDIHRGPLIQTSAKTTHLPLGKPLKSLRATDASSHLQIQLHSRWKKWRGCLWQCQDLQEHKMKKKYYKKKKYEKHYHCIEGNLDNMIQSRSA